MKDKMAEDSFLLVSLKEDKAKKLAQVLSNDTSRNILDYLSKHENATETKLAKDLDIPLSTIHYNLTHLVAARLVKNEDFTYSEKGKEVVHYSLSNKIVIIAPKNMETEGLREKLLKFLPVFLVISATTAAIQYFKRLSQPVFNAVPQAFGVAKSAADSMMEESVEMVARAAPSAQIIEVQPHFFDNIAVWFFIGAVFGVMVLLIITHIYMKRD
ncbi:MAG: helix-turn-helix domain-containing protein [Nanoarchaeota archaeon]|nr:helix-turn-helix domain-containing protein [Nanoarchaeota archaeon]